MNKIRVLREHHKMTQSELGKLLNVKDAAISKYESGKVPLTADTIIKLADIFDVSTDYLLGISNIQRDGESINNTNSSSLHLRLQTLLSEDKFLQEDFYSQVSKIPKDIFIQYINGQLSPNAYDLCKLIEAFDTTADYLFGKSEIPHPNKISNNSGCYLSNKIQKEMDGNLLETELAEQLNVSIATIKKILSGESLPDTELLYKLSQILEKSTDYLLGIREKSRPEHNGEYLYKFDSEISRRLKEIASRMDMSYDLIADYIGIEEEEVFNMFEYGFVPHITVINKIADLFSKSTDYLLNRSDSTITVQQDEERLLKVFRQLNEDSKTIAISELLKLEREESLVAAKEELRQGKSYPSNGTEG